MVLLLQNWVMDVNAGIKGARGLANQPEAYLRRQDVLPIAVRGQFGFVALKPGEETTVAIALPVPLNADIKKLKASIEIRSGADSEKATLTQTSTVQEGSDTPKVYNVDIEVPALPRNLSLRLDGGEVFWTSSSSTNEGTFELPDFVAQANSYLDKLPVGTTE